MFRHSNGLDGMMYEEMQFWQSFGRGSKRFRGKSRRQFVRWLTWLPWSRGLRRRQRAIQWTSLPICWNNSLRIVETR